MKEQEFYLNFIGDAHFTSHIPSSRKDNYPESIEAKYLSINELFPSQYNFLAGDIFHSPTVPLKYVNRMARIETQSRIKDNHKTYVIPGNHDVIHSNLDYLGDSALGNWIDTGLVQKLKKLIMPEGEGVQVQAWEFDKSVPVLEEKERRGLNILIGHAFYEVSAVKEKDYILHEEEANESGFDVIVLGHDHAKYEPVKLDNCVIYRPGSLSRGTSHFHNVWREISILRMKVTVNERGEVSYKAKYVNIPSLPPEEVFLASRREGKSRIFKKEMEKFVEQMEGAEIEAEEVYAVLDELKMDDDVKRYVTSLLTAHGIMRE